MKAIKVLKYTASLFLLLLFVMPVTAQDSPKSEIFLGYSLLRTDEDVVNTDAILSRSFFKKKGGDLNGWNLSVSANATSWFGFVGDFSGHYGSINTLLAPTTFGVSGNMDTMIHVFVFGPQFTFRGGPFSVFVRVMGGAARMDQSTTVGSLKFKFDDKAFAAAAGGGLDLRIADRLAIRLIQADYLVTKFNNQDQRNLRVGAGFVIRR
ncbi:MAG: outer membrane beta-barrel protein [Acidobacteria bacterium]|nr:outer membrane beta-barrel protein [Acidobacteriota bacterium]